VLSSMANGTTPSRRIPIRQIARLFPDEPLAFVSQSCGMITAVLDWAASREIGFSHVVSLGEMADVDFGDMLDYLAPIPAPAQSCSISSR
jgi:hypothetical protein